MPVIKAGEAASGGSAGGAAGWTPLAARSAIMPLTVSGDIEGGSCSTTVAPAGSAAQPAGGGHSRSNSATTKYRASISGCILLRKACLPQALDIEAFRLLIADAGDQRPPDARQR